MENKNENVLFELKKLDDADLNTVTGGTNTGDAPKYKLGDIAYIVINQWNPTTEIVKIITAQCQITSEPYKGFLGMWCYDAVILAQDAVYDGYPSLVGRQEREVKERVFDGAARYMSDNGISFK